MYFQVFSAPNYVDQAGNKGAFVRYFNPIIFLPFSSYICFFNSQIRIDSAGTQKYTQFDAKPHPPMKPMAYSSGGLQSLLS